MGTSFKMVKIDITLVKMVKITAISRATSSSPILPQLLQLWPGHPDTKCRILVLRRRRWCVVSRQAKSRVLGCPGRQVNPRAPGSPSPRLLLPLDSSWKITRVHRSSQVAPRSSLRRRAVDDVALASSLWAVVSVPLVFPGEGLRLDSSRSRVRARMRRT